MPIEIQWIDAIARETGRDVLYLTFSDGQKCQGLKQIEFIEPRRAIIEWLGENGLVGRCAAM